MSFLFTTSFWIIEDWSYLPTRLDRSLYAGGVWPSCPGGPSGLKPVPSKCSSLTSLEIVMEGTTSLSSKGVRGLSAS